MKTLLAAKTRISPVTSCLLVLRWLVAWFAAGVGASALAAEPSPSYTRCASESAFCSFRGPGDVMYGAGQSWTAPRRFEDGVACNNAVFGDPRRGVRKSCYVKLAAPASKPSLDRLTLLVPDGADPQSWQVQVWTDTAQEEGIRLDVISDSAFLALGNTAASKIAGLIVPDSAHQRASDALIAAVKQYAYFGGQLLLVYDAGVLTENGTYPLSGNSRFSDLAGVNYVFWNNGLGANTMVGFGPVVSTRTRLESLGIPPGKYAPYAVPFASSPAATYVPASPADPGASRVMREVLLERARQAPAEGSGNVRKHRHAHGRWIPKPINAPVVFGARHNSVTPALSMHPFDRPAISADRADAKVRVDNDNDYDEVSRAVSAPADETLQAINGYGYGPLGYYSYVTTGHFPGTVYLSSPDHGLVAGTRSYGTGKLLFVNLPLGYFKAVGSDSAPLHGFLSHFAREQVGVVTQSVQPEGKGGLIYNWHIDDGDDLLADTKSLLDTTRVLQSGPFSLDLTAGPDVINFGDGKGMDLNNNLTSQALLRRLRDLKADHEIGSHGGWIHDYWGGNASEANVPDLTHLLSQNFDAIERVTGRKIRQYSSPQGNTPVWAVQWLERRGVVGMYLVGDGGSGMVRSWRDGKRLADKLWSFPVTTLGKYATFEEFEEFGISDAVSGQWLLDLQSFVVNQRTNRLFYNHPPGAAGHLKVVNNLLARAKVLQMRDRFAWYTMPQLADFSQRRLQSTWSSSSDGRQTTFTASHPTSLEDITWLLPRSSFAAPRVQSGRASVSADSDYWLVKAGKGVNLSFVAAPAR